MEVCLPSGYDERRSTDAANNQSTQSRLKWEATVKQINLYKENDFSEKAFKKLLVHDSPYFKIINFNFRAGQELPVHSHDIEGQLSLVILEGEGEFLGEGDTTLPAKPGDVVISEIAEPHGLRAKTDLRLLVTIAPPI
jgi:quercetin dioxygenase-like cupin family protein